MSNELETITKAEPRRNRWGQPFIVPRAGGKAVAMLRPSTLGSVLDDRYGLEQWFKRQVAIGLVMRPDLLARAATTDHNDKATLNAICKDAMEAAGSSASATMGTALHAAVEQANLGLEPPAMFADHVAAYRQALAAHGAEVHPDHVEQFCVNENVGAAGTFDMILKIADEWYIADLKTGRDIANAARSYAVQLCIYAGATSYYDPADDTHSDPVKVNQERGIVVHLPADLSGRCTLHWIDLTAGREALEHALWVRQWRRRDNLLADVPAAAAPKPKRTLEPVPMPPLPAPVKEAAEAGAAAKPEPTPTIDHLAEGELVDIKLVHALRDRAINHPHSDRIKAWVAEASAEHCDFSMGKHRHTERRYLISSAAVELADADDDYCRTALAIVHGDMAVDPTVPVGLLFGSLSLDQARKLEKIARTCQAFYDDNGNVVIEEAS